MATGGFAGVGGGAYGGGAGRMSMPPGPRPSAQGSWSGGRTVGGRLPTAGNVSRAPTTSAPAGGGGGTLPQQSYAAYLRGEKKGIPAGMSFEDYQRTYFGGGGAGGGGGAAGATPYGAAGETAETMTETGGGLLDPNSEMGQRYIQELHRDVGKATDASERAAAYRAVMSGMGSGASPELLQTQTELGTAGLEAAGEAEADYRLKAPQLGASLMGGALGAQTAMRGQDLESRIAQQRIALEREMGAAGTAAERDRLEMERERMAEQARLQELGYLYGMF